MAKDSRRRLQLRARYARSASLMSKAVKEQDKHCIITEFSRSIQNAHVLPRDQSAWFELHSMDLYCHNPQALIDDTANGLALRSDVLECFDRCSFVFFPLDDSTYLAYIVGGSESHYVELLHRRPVVMPERVSEFFLYARFAYNILAHVRPWWTKYGATIPVQRLQVKGAMTGAKDHAGPLHPSETSSSSESLSDVQTLEKEERWTARWKARFPDLNEESVDPPDTRIFSHPDSLRIRRLADAYMAKNPQIFMSSSGSRLHDDGSALYAED
ncbi:hypothetical protein L227DRAFT_283113 [Lentinus tigrinus ALCF2SS1-6]|uniref:HNH nuclease domain-containing protein n=1 Tax=Lentinus tigrinus ALCF2SS1-6 TaxID=1328759 RepID=A0A5C2RZ05_9APHY|nr:hypothetical protein L227DRAFT_283113 [Lentinus tigrinus ALCF2SS1-6]